MAHKSRRRQLRLFRWIVKAIFLFIFLAPFSFILAGQLIEVKSLISGSTFAVLPITQSPDSIWLSYYGNVAPGLWIIEPFGGIQVLLTGLVEFKLLLATVIALLLFVAFTVLLGNVFCSWICPLGTLIDGFDMFLGKFTRRIEAKREKRRLKSKSHGSHEAKPSNPCSICPITNLFAGCRLAGGLALSSLVATFFLKFPVFCVVCPVGIVSRGMIHLKSIKTALRIKGTKLTLWFETLLIPLAAVCLCIIERRFWCKRICPIRVFLNFVGAFNPFIKPRVQEDKCIMYGCPGNCKDASLDYCGACRIFDARKCEEVCPAEIKILEHGSLAGCTKCMECYLACEYDAITIDWMASPEILKIFRRSCK